MRIVPVPGSTGEYEVEGLGFKFKMADWRMGDLKDSVQTPDAINAGTKLYVFRDVTGKNTQHNNQDNNAGRMAAHTELIINRISVYVPQAVGGTLITDSDIIKVTHAASLEVIFNSDRKVAEGPLFQFPSGYGVTGSTTRNATGVVTNGAANVAGAPQMLVAQRLGPNDSFRGEITFYDNSWLTLTAGSVGAAITAFPALSIRLVLTCMLEGLLKKSTGR